jgi:hypothetical protein
MKRIAGYSLIALLLSAVPAAMLVSYAAYERQMARADEAFAVFDFDAAATTAGSVDRALGHVDVLPWAGGALRTDARRRVAEARYWQGAYDTVAAAAERRASDDPRLIFIVANARFRQAGVDPDRRAAAERLEAAILGYKRTLDADPDNLRAAFNYEYSLRVRKAMTSVAPPRDANPHGIEGGTPESNGMDKVHVLIPMQAGEGEKKSGADAGKGGRKPGRKGP